MPSFTPYRRNFASALLLIGLGCEAGEGPVQDSAAPAPRADPQQASNGQRATADEAGSALFDAGSLPAAERDGAAALLELDAGTRHETRDAAPAIVADAATPIDAASAPRDASVVFDGTGGGDLCPDGFARGDASLTLARIAPFKPSPEGVAVCPGGEVFVTVDGPDEIRRVPLDGGAPELYAALPGYQPASIACDERGRLFVAALSRRDGGANPPILMVSARNAGAVALPLPAMGVGALNGIIAVRGAGVFASDTANGNVLRARELADGGFETSIVASNLLGANGFAYAAKTRKLYMVVSFLPPRVVSFDLGADGTLSAAKEELNGSVLTLFDGVAVDAAGTLYVADYSGGAVLRGREQAVIATLSDPASFAFRGGTLLLTSYHLGMVDIEGGLYALQLGVCGGDHP